MTLPTNLTELQSDYAVFLPALSTFYALFIGRQRRGLQPYDENVKASGVPYIPLDRIPAHLPHGVESMNWLDPKDCGSTSGVCTVLDTLVWISPKTFTEKICSVIATESQVGY
jgi:hypothetical protein